MAVLFRQFRNKFIHTSIHRGTGKTSKLGRYYKSVPFTWVAPAHHGSYLQNCSISIQKSRSWSIKHYIYAGHFAPPAVIYVSKYHKRWKKFYAQHRWGQY